MEFNNLIRIANKNEIKAEKQRCNLKPVLPPPSTSKKDTKQAKGIKSAAVRAFLAEQERKEKEQADKVKAKPARDTTNVPAVSTASASSSQADNEPDVDLKKLFNKNDRRVARLPDTAITNMMDVLKERERLRKQKAKEEEEEQIRREKELQRERERERELEKEREREEKAAQHMSSKHKIKSKHSFDHHSNGERTAGGNGRNDHFKIPKKPPPKMSFDEIMALAAKKQGEPEGQTPTVLNKQSAPSVKAERSRPMTQAEKDRIARVNSEEYQNWLKNGGPPPKMNNQKSSKNRSNSNSQDTLNKNNALQLDRRKTNEVEVNVTRSDQNKVADKGSRSNDRSRLTDKGRSSSSSKLNDHGQPNGQVKSNDQGQSSGRSKPGSQNQTNTSRSSSGRIESSSERKDKPVDAKLGQKKESRSLESNHHVNRQPVQKDLPVKTVKGEKSAQVNNSNTSINKRPETAQVLKSNGSDVVNKVSSSGLSSQNNSQRNQVIKDFYSQCKKLRESGFLSESLLKNLEIELKNKLKALSRNPGSDVPNPKPSGNNTLKTPVAHSSRPSERVPVKPSTSQGHPSSLKTPDKAKSSENNSSGSSLKREEKKSDGKQMSTWDRIQVKNKQFKPQPAPVAAKRHYEGYSDSEDEDDEEDEYEDEDDDMDSFIDDGDDAGADYSMYIRRLTKYDPTKYDDDFDDPSMETNYAQLLKEEAYSAREGRREDIEDMIMEEEENKRKLMKKKAAKRVRLS